MLHKPDGYVSATEDSRERTVLELIKGYEHYELFPVGRLDKDTEGLLILSNDGKMAIISFSKNTSQNIMRYDARSQRTI